MSGLDFIYPEDPEEFYDVLLVQLKNLLEGERQLIAGLSNAAALLYQALPGVSWAGFYLYRQGGLLLGPFQGKPACIRIPVGKGVCGAALEAGKTQLVADVLEYPGHIACDSAARSELVIPIYAGGGIAGVLDLDSPQTARFDQVDAARLREAAGILAEMLDWPGKDYDVYISEQNQIQ